MCDGRIDVNCPGLPPGIYLVKVKTNSFEHVVKTIINQ